MRSCKMSTPHCVSLSLIVLSVLLSIHPNAGHSRFRTSGFEKEWDLVIFTQTWPVSECLEWKQRTGRECNMPDNHEWTIHGIWPTKLGTKGPEACNPELEFDMSAIESLLGELEERWLSVQGGKGDRQFWEHEWDKHGTCAVKLSQLDTEYKYFKTGLEWNTKYNLDNILKKVGLTPGGSVNSVQQLHDDVTSLLGYRPALSCFKDKVTGQRGLLELRICFNKSLELAHCDGDQRYDRREITHTELISNCPFDEPITLPESIF